MATNESITDILRAVRALAEMSGSLPSAARREVHRIAGALEELGVDATGAAPPDELTVTTALKQGLQLEAKKRRHDAKAVPRGFDFDGTFLAREEPERAVTAADVNVARSIEGTLGLWLRERRRGKLRPVAEVSPRLAELPIRRALADTYEAIFGAPPGQEWQRHLARALEHDLLVQERDRLRAVHGWPLGREALLDGPEGYILVERPEPNATVEGEIELVDELEQARGPDDILAHVRLMSLGLVPAEITVAVVAEALRETTLGGGRGGKTPHGWVRAFAKKIGRKDAG
ncbi:MAG: hypothetical protein IT384_22980 [Deltaproteobacteria bacterium]|nr:hypothetical protein [Deltaproteobacteria bacterium]